MQFDKSRRDREPQTGTRAILDLALSNTAEGLQGNFDLFLSHADPCIAHFKHGVAAACLKPPPRAPQSKEISTFQAIQSATSCDAVADIEPNPWEAEK